MEDKDENNFRLPSPEQEIDKVCLNNSAKLIVLWRSFGYRFLSACPGNVNPGACEVKPLARYHIAACDFNLMQQGRFN